MFLLAFILISAVTAKPADRVVYLEGENGQKQEIRFTCDSPTYGGASGATFNHEELFRTYGRITELTFHEDNIIAGLAVKYGNTYSALAGSAAGQRTVYKMPLGSVIRKIEGRHTSGTLGRVDQLYFEDNLRNSIGPFGSGGSGSFSMIDDDGLLFISGRSSSLLDAITFHFECWNNEE